jgi:hypothetical protein
LVQELTLSLAPAPVLHPHHDGVVKGASPEISVIRLSPLHQEYIERIDEK